MPICCIYKYPQMYSDVLRLETYLPQTKWLPIAMLFEDFFSSTLSRYLTFSCDFLLESVCQLRHSCISFNLMLLIYY